MKKPDLFLLFLLCAALSLNSLQAQTADKWYKKGEKAYQNEKYQKAIEAFTKAIRKDYSPLEHAYINRGVVKDELGQYTAAIKDYDQAILINPKYAYAYNNRGLAKYNLGQYTAAIKDYDQAILLNPKYADVYNNRGVAKDDLGQYTAAIKDYDQAILINPKYAYAYNNRGLAKYNLGQYTAAIKDYDQAIAVGGADYKPARTYRSDAVAQLNKSQASIVWRTPSETYTTTTQTTHTLSACIDSKSEITQTQLLVNGEPYVSGQRDFVIQPAFSADCAHPYERTITLPASNETYTITLKVSNQNGTVQAKRRIQVLPTTEKRLALVIGNSNYGNGNYLSNPVHDADDMASALKNIGFTVLKHHNVTAPQFEKAINKFKTTLQDYDVGLFYYAGHGLQYENTNYLVPLAAQLEDEADIKFNTMPVQRLVNKMELADTKVNIVILDACRNNQFLPNSARGAGDRGLAPMSAPNSSIIIYATDAGQVASDNPSGRNGLFTGELLKFITTPGLLIEQVVKKTTKSVYEKSGGKQEPAMYSKLLEDFYFVPK